MTKLNDQIEDYLRFGQIERGLSENTITAYRQDLTEFLNFLQQEKIDSWPTEAVEIDAFLARQKDLNKASSSISRMISSLRKFYQWLARQNIQKLNPMIEIDSPKKQWRLPVALTQDENKPDLVIVNPPRRGIGKELAEFLNEMQPHFILYSSCNAISMGKDLQHLTNYKLTQIQLFDMFPHTAHYEVLTLLKLNS